ncbi:hypothetical protein [Streptomyces jeddahensis]|uniref:Uncharacterized protein n=1 Tax=Streptomyces jeddahensis TaxID=1716141 RepID=A0A177HSZ7_9ACTN|nr:hypothetical protein [Streptomyces jeddahensis]OAH14122.1 hypothetical protein STSP_25710 [Streptomyces jeddahensis]
MPSTSASSATRDTVPLRRPGTVKRSRTRRAGESAYGLLLLGRQVVLAGVVLLLLVGGVWQSWGSAQHVMFTKGRERGTMTVTRCGEETCTGSYVGLSPGSQPRGRVVIERSIAEEKGAKVPVVIKPGTDEVVRSGVAGLLHAWVPLGGALLLAAVVIAGGLRMTRTAWVTAALGLALLTASFATL